MADTSVQGRRGRRPARAGLLREGQRTGEPHDKPCQRETRALQPVSHGFALRPPFMV